MAKVYKEHYNIDKLISTLDCDGNKPAFYIVCSKDRGPGKTFSFSKLLINNFLDKGEKFILLTRNMGDLGNIASGVLDGYLQIEYPDISVYETIQMKGVFSKIFMNVGSGEDKETRNCGYVIPIRAADQIKKISSMFYDATAFYFDEFQPSTNSTYLKDELGLLYNIYKSVARGEGSAIRYMPIYMASNTITLGNPYFVGLGINSKIQSNTRFYRGKGVVFENCIVEGLSEAHANSPIDQAMKTYLAQRGDNVWINDNNSLVCKPDKWGRAIYICTLVHNNKRYGLRLYPGTGLKYVSRSVDNSCQYVYNLTLDGDLNIPLLRTTQIMIRLRDELYKGLVRVSDGGVQEMLMDVFS